MGKGRGGTTPTSLGGLRCRAAKEEQKMGRSREQSWVSLLGTPFPAKASCGVGASPSPPPTLQPEDKIVSPGDVAYAI